MANASPRISRIFVSHSHYDDGFCHPLVNRIRTALGIADSDTMFYDVESLRAGDDFLPRLQEEVVSRPVFIVILTPHSVAANYVKHETNLALRLTIEHPERRLIPVLAEECDPNMLAPSLMGYQMVDFAHTEL